MPRMTPEGLQNPPLHTGHAISHRKLHPCPVPLLLMEGSSSRGDTQILNISERWRAQAQPPTNP